MRTTLLLGIGLLCGMAAGATERNMNQLPADLKTPALTEGEPAPGKRVRQVWPEWVGTGVYHALYLPMDWAPGRTYPVIVEYAGNGDYRSAFGDVSNGTVEGSNLGYGISGGRGFIWVCLPFVDAARKQNATHWWGDPDATAAYCRQSAERICTQFGGDAKAVFLAGFSRGAIACNYIGLRDDATARLWVGFIAHSHYDGVIETWPYSGADRASALARLQRLNGRPVFISDAQSVDQTRLYLEATGVRAPFTYQVLPWPNHSDAWVLRDVPERQKLREWVRSVLASRGRP